MLYISLFGKRLSACFIGRVAESSVPTQVAEQETKVMQPQNRAAVVVVGSLGFVPSPDWRCIATPAYFYADTFSIFSDGAGYETGICLGRYIAKTFTQRERIGTMAMLPGLKEKEEY